MSKCLQLGCVFPAVVNDTWCRNHAHDREAEMSPTGSSAGLSGIAEGSRSHSEFVIDSVNARIDGRAGDSKSACR